MTATNFNRAICDELMNNSIADDMYFISHERFPMGEWKITRDIEGLVSIERTQEIGNYAVISIINLFYGKKMELGTNIYLHNREEGGKIEYYAHETKEIDEELLFHVRMFIDSVRGDSKE